MCGSALTRLPLPQSLLLYHSDPPGQSLGPGGPAYLEEGCEDNGPCIAKLEGSQQLGQHLVAAKILRERVQALAKLLEELLLLSRLFDLGVSRTGYREESSLDQPQLQAGTESHPRPEREFNYMGSGAQQPGFKSQLPHLAATWPWAHSSICEVG